MKNLLGIDLGHSALTVMCSILKDKNRYNSNNTHDEFLLRGAVFHTCMGVFGVNSSQSHKLPLASSTVLYSYLKVRCKTGNFIFLKKSNHYVFITGTGMQEYHGYF